MIQDLPFQLDINSTLSLIREGDAFCLPTGLAVSRVRLFGKVTNINGDWFEITDDTDSICVHINAESVFRPEAGQTADVLGRLITVDGNNRAVVSSHSTRHTSQ